MLKSVPGNASTSTLDRADRTQRRDTTHTGGKYFNTEHCNFLEALFITFEQSSRPTSNVTCCFLCIVRDQLIDFVLRERPFSLSPSKIFDVGCYLLEIMSQITELPWYTSQLLSSVSVGWRPIGENTRSRWHAVKHTESFFSIKLFKFSGKVCFYHPFQLLVKINFN